MDTDTVKTKDREGRLEEEDDDHTIPLSEILNLNRELGVHDVEGQRVLQVRNHVNSGLKT